MEAALARSAVDVSFEERIGAYVIGSPTPLNTGMTRVAKQQSNLRRLRGCGPSKKACFTLFGTESGEVVTQQERIMPEVRALWAKTCELKASHDPTLARDAAEALELQFHPQNIIPSRTAAGRVMRGHAPSGTGPDGKTVPCSAACSLWLAGLLPAVVNKLGAGRWHPREWPLEVAQYMVPEGTRLCGCTFRKRLCLNHTLGHIVPKPAKKSNNHGVPIHTADRIRLVHAQQAIVRLLEDAVAPRIAEAYQDVIGRWQAA